MTETEIPSAAAISKLIESANLQYGLKNYDGAAELYSRATEMQGELNGEMAHGNADLLYLYGRCLYKVAVSKSDVLGAKVASEDKSKKKSKSSNGEGSSSAAAKAESIPTSNEKIAEDVVEAAVEAKDGMKPAPSAKAADKPYFSITGDENWDTDSDEEDAGGEGGEEEEEDDDMQNAYEILDMARVILQHKLEAHTGQTKSEDDKGKGKATEVYPGDVSDPVVRSTKEKLADILDLQADISLESERFHDAVPDNQATLALRKEFLPAESSLIAESHYKLSLALEFASVTAIRESDAAADADPPQIDEAMRAEAAVQMEEAIASCRLRIEKEEGEIVSLSGDEKAKKQKDIKEVKEILEEMEQRLVDLKASPVEVPNLAGPAGANDANPLGGLLGSILGESPAEQKARIEEATKGATDLSNMVRKKKPAPEPVPAAKGKRKIEDDDDSDTSKKAKVDDA